MRNPTYESLGRKPLNQDAYLAYDRGVEAGYGGMLYVPLDTGDAYLIAVHRHGHSFGVECRMRRNEVPSARSATSALKAQYESDRVERNRVVERKKRAARPRQYEKLCAVPQTVAEPVDPLSTSTVEMLGEVPMT